MPDSQRVPVPDPIAAGIADARARADEATAERDLLIVEALRLGCSLRDVARAAGLGPSRVQQIGKEHGWPPPELIAAEQEAREAARRWREDLDLE